MNKALYVITSAMVLVSLFSESSLSTEHTNHPQNTQKAVEYFGQELAFTTNPYGVKTAIDNQEKNILIVDVRSAEAYAKGHIPGAINIPGDQFNYFKGSYDTFPSLKKDKVHYVYCYNLLCELGKKAAIAFAEKGYQVKEIKGGFESWEQFKYPIEK
jgi:rhodanese-related sulfurtransferase